MIPRSWAYSKAAAMCDAIFHALSKGSGPLSESLSTRSITGARSSTR